MRILIASFFIISSLTLTGVSAHQWDVSVPKLQERMMLATTHACQNCALSNTELSYKRLERADLSGANLQDVNFMRTNLRQADLRYSNLSQANLIWANLSGADLRGATLLDAVISESRNLDEAIFCETTMPDGSLNNANC